MRILTLATALTFLAASTSACDEPGPAATGTTDAGGTPLACIGPEVGAAAAAATPGPTKDPDSGAQADEPWRLTDFQPQSCGYDSTYGLEAFHGHVTVVALFAAW